MFDPLQEHDRDRHEDEGQANTTQRLGDNEGPKRRTGGHLKGLPPGRDAHDEDSDRSNDAQIPLVLRHDPGRHRIEYRQHAGAHHQQEAGHGGGEAERVLDILRLNEDQRVHRCADREEHDRARPNVTVAKDAQRYRRMFGSPQLPRHEPGERNHREDRAQHDRRIVEPAVAFTFVEHVLHRG